LAALAGKKSEAFGGLVLLSAPQSVLGYNASHMFMSGSHINFTCRHCSDGQISIAIWTVLAIQFEM